MKILWVKTDFLHPTCRGGQIRTLEILKRLNQRHEIHFAALDLPEPGEGIKHSSEYCARAYSVPHPVPQKGGARYWAELAAGLFTTLPVAMLRYQSRVLGQELERLTRLYPFDAIVCDGLTSATNIPELGRVLLFQHNIGSARCQLDFESATTPFQRAYWTTQYERILRYESEVCRRVKKVVAVSEADARVMRSLYGVARIFTVPTGVDVPYFTPPGALAPWRDLIFSAAMDRRPNADGLHWFVNQVLPLIRARLPNCSLAVVGHNPGMDVRRLQANDSRIQVTGTVDDVRPYLWDSTVSIVPLRSGGGTRLKVYEAMAAKVPVVSTSLGAEGLDIRDGENIAIADSPEQFAQACLNFLLDPEARWNIARNAWEMVAACYSWEVVSRKFETLLE